MGTEAAWVPAVIALVGAGVQQYNTSQTNKSRDADIAQGIRNSSAQQQKGDQAINRNLDELSKSRAEPFKSDLQDSFIQKINAKRMLGTAGLDTSGGTSDAYKTGAANAKTGATDYAGVISDLLSTVDAAGNQRRDEGNKKGETGMDLLRFKRNSDQEGFLAEMRARRHRDNPWLSMLGSGLSAYGSSGGSLGFGGGGAPAASGATGVGEFNTNLGLDKYMIDRGGYRGITG